MPAPRSQPVANRMHVRMTQFPSIRLHVGSLFDFKRRKAAVKEPETVAWLRQCLAEHGPYTLVDVGANVGGYSLIACGLDADVRCIAVEPFPPSFLTLCRNIVLNGLTERILPVNGMVGDGGAAGAVPLRFNAWRSGVADHPADGRHTLRLPAIAAGRLQELTRAASAVVCKVDVDGAEDCVMGALVGFLSDGRVKSVLVECDSRTREAVERIVEHSGLAIAARHEKSRPGQINLVAHRKGAT